MKLIHLILTLVSSQLISGQITIRGNPQLPPYNPSLGTCVDYTDKVEKHRVYCQPSLKCTDVERLTQIWFAGDTTCLMFQHRRCQADNLRQWYVVKADDLSKPLNDFGGTGVWSFACSRPN